jgi:hypothetical protein
MDDFWTHVGQPFNRVIKFYFKLTFKPESGLELAIVIIESADACVSFTFKCLSEIHAYQWLPTTRKLLQPVSMSKALEFLLIFADVK